MSSKGEAVFRYSERGGYGLIEQADGHTVKIGGITLEQFRELQRKFVEGHTTRGCPFSHMQTLPGFLVR